MAGHPDIENDIDPEQVEKEPKVDVAALGHAVGDERAVVVEKLHAAIALFAVYTAPWSHYVAGEAVFELGYVG